MPKHNRRDVVAYFRTSHLSFVSGWTHGAAGACGLHSHPAFEIVYHAAGSGVSRLATGEEVAFTPGDAVIYAPYLRHDQTMAVDGEDVCVQVGTRAPLPAVLQACFLAPRVEDPSLLADLRMLASGGGARRDLEQLAFDHRATSVLIALMDAAIDVSAAPSSPDIRHAEAAHRYIAEHYRSISTIDDVAAAVGIGYGHLRHCFRARYGISLVRWLSEVRIERAKELLVHSILSLREIASHCGYANERYFSTVFNALVGLPPGGFRKRT